MNTATASKHCVCYYRDVCIVGTLHLLLQLASFVYVYSKYLYNNNIAIASKLCFHI